MVSNRQSWYVVHCKPLKEWQAAAVLEERLGLTVYLPEISRRFRGRIQRAPLFPRYLFVLANLHAVPLSHINAAPGVLRLVTFGELPPSIPTITIEALRQRVDDINSCGGLPEHGFHPGDTIRLKAGPLQGLEAIFVEHMKSSEQVRVLIDFIGRLNKIEVDVGAIERPNAEALPKRERRTRGKGRRVKG